MLNLPVRCSAFPAVCFSFLLCTSALAQQRVWGPALDSKPAFSVAYTGALFGYFRFPDEQSTSDSGCPSFGTGTLPPQVAAFQTTLQHMKAGAQAPLAFVSMGDNFAPELLARFIRNRQADTPHFGELISKDLLDPNPTGAGWQTAGLPASALPPGQVPSDNVACFLRLAGVNAVVPGQQDFYFGPERLRQLARFLASDATPGYNPVQMLAANLTVESVVHHPAPRLPATVLPKELRAALAPSNQVEFKLPAAIMPWLTAVSLSDSQTKSAAGFTVFDCPALPDNPEDFILPTNLGNKCNQLIADSSKPYSFRLQKAAQRSSNFLSYYTLDPGTNHALCVEYQKQSKTGKVSQGLTCKLFTVAYPFLQYLPQPHTSGVTPQLYFLSQDQNANYVIFGVLDPNLASYAGQLENTWLNTDRRYDTRLSITDPVEALQQQLDLCDSDPNCVHRHKILLAQMPYFKASQLATKLKVFDVVVTQADFEHSTGEEYSSRTLTPQSQPLVLTPGFTFDPLRPAPLSVNLRSADIYFAPASDGSHRQFIANSVFDTPVLPPSPASRPAVGALERGASVVAAATNPLGSSENYETLALTTMQDFCASDIALLQHRDVFSQFQKAIAYWPAGNNYGVQALLNEVLWKGDFAFCLPVKGSTLKKVLAESAAFDQEDLKKLSLEVFKKRGLSKLGITADPVSGAPLIRGQAIDDTRLYGVAMTDYLAFGDTGYPELSSEAIPPPVRITKLKALNRLTGLACQRLPAAVSQGSCQSEEINASQYFDAISQRPSDTSPGLTALRQLRVWATHPLEPQPVSTFLSKNDGTPESAVDHRGVWFFTLQNLALNYNLSFLRGSDKSIPANFSGINTFSQLSTPESSQLGLWTRLRGGYSFPRFIDFYASGEERYTRAAVRLADASGDGNFGPYQLTLNNNIVRGEAGLLSKPLTQNFPVRVLVSENLFTQVSDPFTQLSAPVAGVPGATTLTTFDLAKNFLVMTRLGARLQNQRSWFEAGREYGENIGIPIGYRVQDQGRAAPLSCNLSGNVSLSSCVAADPLFTTASRVLPNLETQAISGWFMDFHTAAPIVRSRVQLTIDSYTEKFDKRATDTSFNTRFYEDLTVALRIPLWSNLTFAPQVESFFYQDKVVPGQSLLTNHYAFVTSSLKLEYGFDWHRGVGIVRALRYPAGAPFVASPIPSAAP